MQSKRTQLLETTNVPPKPAARHRCPDLIFPNRGRRLFRTQAVELIGIIVLLLLGHTDVFGQNTVTREVISGGSGTTASTGYLVRGTLSQTGIGRITHGNNDRHDAGFWYWAYQPELVAKVFIPQIEANVGNRLTIPLQLTTSQLRGSFFPRGFRARIRFNSTLVHLTQNTPVCSYDGDDCVVEFTGTAQGENGTIAELECIAALGNDLSTELVIEEFEWERRAEERVTVTKENGELRLLDVCREGDQIRLIQTVAASRLRLWPNPAEEQTTLEFIANESGPVDISLVNMLGSKATSLVAEDIEADRIYRMDINLRDVPSGSYMVVYRTATGTLTQRLMIRH